MCVGVASPTKMKIEDRILDPAIISKYCCQFEEFDVVPMATTVSLSCIDELEEICCLEEGKYVFL